MNPLQPLAIALGLGLLVGLQRQWKDSEIAGIRTFPLITMFGTMTILLDEGTGGWVSAAGLLATAAMLIIGNQTKLRSGENHPGMTTEMAALLMYVVGAALGAGFQTPAIAVGGVVAVLLHWKDRLHAFVHRIGEADVRAVMHLVLIALVILPVLPDETYGPYDVLNPHKIWLMVVLIVGISLAAYVASRILGQRVGSILGGIFGGLISSTATTVSYARQTRSNQDASAIAAVVIMIASTIVNIRVLVEIGVVAPELLRFALLPMASLTAAMILLCALVYFTRGKSAATLPNHDNPAQLKPAIIFGALYAVILFLVAAASDLFGEEAIYGVAFISGLTDVDAITLSTAKLFNDERVTAQTAWRVILVATMSNLIFKGIAVAMLGSRTLLKMIALLFGVSLLAGVAILLLWPNVSVALPAVAT